MEGKEIFIVKIFKMKENEIPAKHNPRVTVIPDGKVIVKEHFFMMHREGDCDKHERLTTYFKQIIDEIRTCDKCKNKKIEIYRTT